MYTKDEVKAGLRSLLENIDKIGAVWEGGSAATGYEDEYSDLDLIIVSNDECADELFDRIENHLADSYGISRKFRVPEPAWHKMSQCFYLLEGCGDYFYADIAIVHKDNPDKFTEPDRHGHAVIWFDRQSLYHALPSSTDEQQKLCKKYYQLATAIDFVIIRELKKGLARKNWIAAQSNYMQFINRCLVTLLNIIHRPCKVDFGGRYLDRDYPKADAELVQDLLKVSSIDDISEKFQLAHARYIQLLALTEDMKG